MRALLIFWAASASAVGPPAAAAAAAAHAAEQPQQFPPCARVELRGDDWPENGLGNKLLGIIESIALASRCAVPLVVRVDGELGMIMSRLVPNEITSPAAFPGAAARSATDLVQFRANSKLGCALPAGCLAAVNDTVMSNALHRAINTTAFERLSSSSQNGLQPLVCHSGRPPPHHFDVAAHIRVKTLDFERGNVLDEMSWFDKAGYEKTRHHWQAMARALMEYADTRALHRAVFIATNHRPMRNELAMQLVSLGYDACYQNITDQIKHSAVMNQNEIDVPLSDWIYLARTRRLIALIGIRCSNQNHYGCFETSSLDNKPRWSTFSFTAAHYNEQTQLASLGPAKGVQVRPCAKTSIRVPGNWSCPSEWR